MRPTCLNVDKNLPTEKNLQRSKAVVLPRSTTFCKQHTKIVSLVINLPVNSLNRKFFPVHIAPFVSTFVSFTITGNHESSISEQFFRFLGHPVWSNDRPGQLFLRQQIPQNTFPPATSALVPFQPLQPAQVGYSGTVPLPLTSTPPETPEPEEVSSLTIRGKQEESAENGGKKWKSFLWSYGVTSTQD